MTIALLQERGRGPEIQGTRITVYDLLPYFLDATATEAYLCRLYELTPEQVTAARAYVFHHLDSVLGEHLRIEARIAEGNPPAVAEQAGQDRDRFRSFKEWLARRDADGRNGHPQSGNEAAQPPLFPSFREWFAEHGPGSAKDS